MTYTNNKMYESIQKLERKTTKTITYHYFKYVKIVSIYTSGLLTELISQPMESERHTCAGVRNQTGKKKNNTTCEIC